jgi:hypothetical protein
MQLIADISFVALMLVSILALASPYYRRVSFIILIAGMIGFFVRLVFGASIVTGYAMASIDVLCGLAICFIFQEKPKTLWLNFGSLSVVFKLGLIQGLFSISHIIMILSFIYKTPTMIYTHYELILFILQLSSILVLFGGVKHAWEYWCRLGYYIRDSVLNRRVNSTSARFAERLP